MKICTKCKIEKFYNNFYKDKYNKDGYKSYCKECSNLVHFDFLKRNPNIGKEINKRYSKNHKEEIKQRNKSYRLNNQEKLAEYEKNRSEVRKPYRKIYNEEYYKNNKNKIIIQNVEYCNKREKKDILYRLRRRLRTRLYCAIRNGQKKGSAVRDLGCSVSELKQYLESKFKPNMSWDNYGEWHIDHIIPLSSFGLTSREQFLEACNYTNLQPLWMSENLQKGAKVI